MKNNFQHQKKKNVMASHGKENEINIKMTYTQISQQNKNKKSQSSESMI